MLTHFSQRYDSGEPSPAATSSAPELVTVQRDGVGLIIRPRPPDVRGWRVIQEFLLDRVPVEPGDSAQPPGDRGAGPSPGLQVAGEAFDVGAADSEQGHRSGTAPGRELAQVQGVCLAGQTAVPGQIPGEGEPSGVSESGLIVASAVDGAAVITGHLPAGLEPGRPGQFRSQRLNGNPT